MENKYEIGELTYSLVDNNKNIYFLLLNKRRFYVGIFVIEILELLRKQKSYQEIAVELNKNHSTDLFNESSIQKTVEVDFVEQGILHDGADEVKSDHQQYIYGRINFLKAKNYPRVLHFLGYLFSPALFVIISALAIIATCFFLVQNYDFVIRPETYSIQLLLFLFLFSVINTFWHEVGHATAAYRFGVDPKDIGFGFYIVYPIFFTDVSDIWQLNKNQRNVVNLGGIYFQLIVNIILIGLYYISPMFWFSPILITLNTGAALISLNPFFRYDGYWVYSDSFGLTNLRLQSNLYAKSFSRKIIGKESKNWKELLSEPKPLIFYSIASTLFFIVIFTLLTFSFIIQTGSIIDIAKEANITGWSKDAVWSITTKALAIIMLPVFIIWTLVKRKK